jgi:hypothetical protein
MNVPSSESMRLVMYTVLLFFTLIAIKISLSLSYNCATGKKSDLIWNGLSKIGTVFFTHWGNGESLTYSDFPSAYNLREYNFENCGLYEY